jgi:GAF domain-containing protein
MMSERSDPEKPEWILDLKQTLASEADSDRALRRVLEEARVLTGARYAALGVLDEGRLELERFVTSGMDTVEERAIGEFPRGRGVLGVLIADPRPLRLVDLRQHPHSYGFPLGHPPMRSFLGVPIMIAGEPWGNLYLTEKEGGRQFTAADERAAVRLACLVAGAIERERG